MLGRKQIIYLIVALFLISLVSASLVNIGEIKIKSDGYKDLDNKDIWVVSWIEDGFTGETLLATILPNELEERSGFKAKQSLKIKSDGTNNRCEYRIDASEFPLDVFILTPVRNRFWGLSNPNQEALKWAKDNCYGANKDANSFKDMDTKVWGDYNVFFTDVKCIKKQEKLATIGRIEDKKISFETKWSVQAGDKTPQTKTIGNDDVEEGKSTKIGDNVWILWQGNLGSGDTCPDPDNELGAHSNSFANGWKVIEKRAYERYAEYVTEGVGIDVKSWHLGQISESFLKSKLSQKSFDAIEEKEFKDYGVIDQREENGRIKINLEDRIIYPMFRLFIDSDYLELIKPTGKPSIISVSDVEFAEGLIGTTEVKVKNIGDDKGEFDVWIPECTNNFESADTKSITIEKGEIKTLNFRVTGQSISGTKTEETGTCTVFMKEITTQELVKKSISVTMTQIQECIPNTKVCSFKDDKEVIKQCNKAGLKYETSKICEESEECKDTITGVKCVKKEDNGNGNGECKNILELGGVTLIPNLKCLPFFTTILWIATILIGVFVLFIMYSFASERSDNQGLNWFVAIIFGVGAGILTYFLFWYGVLLFIVFLTLRLLIPKPIRTAIEKEVKKIRKK